MMNKLLIGLLGAGVIATGGYTAASGLADSQPARTVSLPGAATADDTTTATTAGATTAAATTADNEVRNEVENEVEDVSGPCDEAEHANDPRCAAGATAPDDTADDENGEDRSGSNRGSDDGNDDHGGDRSGSDSGKG